MAREARVSILLTAKDQASTAINTVRSKITALTNGTVASMLGIQGAIGALVGGAVAAKLTSFLISTSRHFERLWGQIRTFTATTEAANLKLEELQRFTDRMPGTLDETTDAWVRLRRVGLDPTATAMEQLADLGAGFGAGLAEVADGIESASIGMFRGLQRFGIKATESGDRLKVTFRGVTEEIGKDSASIAGYMMRIGQANFAGVATRDMSDLDVELKNLHGNLEKLAMLVNQGGVKEGFTSVAAGVNEFTQSVVENGAAVQWWTRLIIALGGAIWQTVVMPVRTAWNLATAAGRAILGLFTSFGWGVSKLGEGIAATLASIQEAITGAEATVLRNAERAQREGAERMARANTSLLNGLEQDAKDVGSAIYNLGDSYLTLARAASASVEAVQGFNFAQSEGLSDQEKAIDLLRTQAQYAGDAATRQKALNQLLVERKKIQADLDAGFKAGKDMTDPGMKRSAGLLANIDATVASTQRTTKGGGSGEDELKKRIDLLTRATQHERTRARALKELATLEGELQQKLKRGTLTYEQQVEVEDRRAQILQTLRDVEEKQRRAEEERLQLLVEAAGYESTRAEAVPRLVEEEQRLTAALQNQNLTLAERVRLEKQRHDVRDGITSGTDKITSERIDLLARATQFTATRAAAVAELRQIEAKLNEEEARGVQITRDGITTSERLAQVRAMIASATTGALQVEVEQGVAMMRHDATRAQGRAVLEAAERKLQAAIEDTKTPVTELASLYDQLEEVQERLGRSTVWQRMARQMNGTRTATERLRATVDDMAHATLTDFASASAAAFNVWASGSANAGAAFSSAIVSSLSSAAKSFGDFFMGQAIASFASTFAPPPIGPNPGGPAAGAGYTAAATAMYAISGGLSGAASRIGSGGSNARGGIGDRTAGELSEAKGETTLVIEGSSIFDMQDPKVESEWVRVLESLSGRRVIVRQG